MKKMRSAWLGLCLVALTAASCGFARISELADGGPPSLPLELELLAGDIGGLGNGDGTGAAARFNLPYGVAVDSAGNVYIADVNNSTIRKVTAAGVVTTLAGSAGLTGSADGTGAAARFKAPFGVAVDSAGNVYVADSGNATIRKISAVGDVATLAGAVGGGGSADGMGPAARFFGSLGLAVDGAGNVYVADRGNHTIRKVTALSFATATPSFYSVSALDSVDDVSDQAVF